jgi:2-haloacid dehalogenase
MTTRFGSSPSNRKRAEAVRTGLRLWHFATWLAEIRAAQHAAAADGRRDDEPARLKRERAVAAQRTGANVQLSAVKALVFDVFGTVVDWRTSVARQVEELARQKGLKVDGAAFADAWRAQYGPSMNRVRTGELPWTTLDQLHRMSLDRLLPDFGLKGLTESETVSLNKAWHRLRPWPDAVAGLTKLKRKFIIAPLSNGNISLMTDTAKYAGLPWDCILGAELVRHYKPDPEVYRSAADFLALLPGEVMMVAAHLGDLRGAKAVGLRTAFVVRASEFGNSITRTPDLVPDDSVDISARDFGHLATLLGA